MVRGWRIPKRLEREETPGKTGLAGSHGTAFVPWVLRRPEQWWDAGVLHVHRLHLSDRIFFVTVNLRRAFAPLSAPEYEQLAAVMEGGSAAPRFWGPRLFRRKNPKPQNRCPAWDAEGRTADRKDGGLRYPNANRLC
jgi:hypothetical protein